VFFAASLVIVIMIVIAIVAPTVASFAGATAVSPSSRIRPMRLTIDAALRAASEEPQLSAEDIRLGIVGRHQWRHDRRDVWHQAWSHRWHQAGSNGWQKSWGHWWNHPGSHRRHHIRAVVLVRVSRDVGRLDGSQGFRDDVDHVVFVVGADGVVPNCEEAIVVVRLDLQGGGRVGVAEVDLPLQLSRILESSVND
jgi:hypothetical protein